MKFYNGPGHVSVSKQVKRQEVRKEWNAGRKEHEEGRKPPKF